MYLALKPEVVSSKRLSVEEQHHILQEIVDEVGFSPYTGIIYVLLYCFANLIFLYSPSRTES